MRYAQAYDAYGNIIDHFTQYDSNQTVYVDIGENDYTSNPMVFFSNSRSTKATEVRGALDGNMVSADVPNDLLTENAPLMGAIYMSDPNNSTTQTTIASFEIPVRAQTMPESYKTGNISCTSISLDPTALSLGTGESDKIIATVAPYNTTSSVAWRSSNTEAVTVAYGTVLATTDLPTATYEGTCATAASTSHKQIEIDSNTSTSALANATVTVKFDYAQTADGVYFTFEFNNMTISQEESDASNMSWKAGDTLYFTFEDASGAGAWLGATVTATCGTRTASCNVVVATRG